MSERKTRIAVIGVGNMGSHHVSLLRDMSNVALTAVCDCDERALKTISSGSTTLYDNHRDLLDAGNLDAAVIATPHYDHVPIAIDCLEHGIHTMVEKPVSVHVNEANRLVSSYDKLRVTDGNLVCGAMFNLRVQNVWKTVKNLLAENWFGRLVRVTWIATDWFRTQYYYDTGGWRASWKGEGGGLLLNQCPHNLDLYQWFFGMPARVRSVIGFGKYHTIETEDEAIGVLEHKSGLVGTIIASTGESPGTNRLEIVGERGQVVVESGVIRYRKNSSSMLDEIRDSQSGFAKVSSVDTEEVPEDNSNVSHRIVLDNFIQAIHQQADLVAPVHEGVHSLALANAMLLSAWTNKVVEMPLDGQLYESYLLEKVKKSRPKDPATSPRQNSTSDFTQSF